ncbi:MAG: PGPGW domain-containing protein [Woeseiaceae bacterium]|nr:PGPGW domain-containing protein [Woeseiaceae bacterium]
MIAVVGGARGVAGLIMLVTPGPALIIIPVGLGILGIEFAWARRWLKSVRERISDTASRSRGWRADAHRRNRY